jgi:hypothetical protein
VIFTSGLSTYMPGPIFCIPTAHFGAATPRFYRRARARENKIRDTRTMSPSRNTFIVAPVRFSASLASRPKTCLMKVEEALAAGTITTPTPADKIGLWLCLQEWANRNVAALEGQRAGHAAGGAGADALGGDGEDG